MSSLVKFILLLGAHWCADFVLQTNWQATNKSKSNVALLRHVLIYTSCIGAASYAIFWPAGALPWLAFVSSNFALHFATDYCTSRLSSRLQSEGRPHAFFVAVGFDQLLHQAALAATMALLS